MQCQLSPAADVSRHALWVEMGNEERSKSGLLFSAQNVSFGRVRTLSDTCPLPRAARPRASRGGFSESKGEVRRKPENPGRRPGDLKPGCPDTSRHTIRNAANQKPSALRLTAEAELYIIEWLWNRSVIL
jgi:hypothetical protein